MSRVNSLLLSMVALTAAGNLAAQGERYDIDPEHTFVTFEVNRFSMVDVVGFFPEASGTIMFDPSDAAKSSAAVTIETASVYLGNSEGRTDAVRGRIFLDVAEYPEMTFVTTRMEQRPSGLVAIGDLTLHGVTHEVAVPFEWKGPFRDPTGLTTITMKGHVTIDRQDFGISFDRRLPTGEPFVGNEVAIELNVLAVKAED